MLGQHPQVYGFPELNLFLTDTVAELLTLGNSSALGSCSYTTGLLRVLAELEFDGQTEVNIRRAIDWVSDRSEWTTKRMLKQLLEWIRPRIGLDKSPRTALSRQALDRALTNYPSSRIIHLTRHPVSTLRSLQETHRTFGTSARLSRDAVWLINFYARVWVQSQELILSVVRELGHGQALQVRAEELLTLPDKCLPAVIEWLELCSDPDVIEAMKHPERSIYARPAPMGLDGDGDPSFLNSPNLRVPNVSQSLHVPSEWKLEPWLSDKVTDLSHQLGYGNI
jgi:hypothetical protein